VTALDLPGFMDRKKPKKLVFTYSNLSTYLTCPEQFHRRYVKKDLGPYVQSAAARQGDVVHAALEARVGAGRPLPAELAAWERFASPFDGRGARVELKLAVDQHGKGCGFWDDQAWLRGKLDLVVLSADSAFLLDWKYKAYLSKVGAYESPFELELHALLLACNEGQRAKVTGHYGYETGLSRAYDLSDTKGTWTRVRGIAQDIERDQQAGEWERKRNGLCKAWCDVRDCPNNGRGL
jgi:hypothetical protein